jgi:hypothetical protein
MIYIPRRGKRLGAAKGGVLVLSCTCRGGFTGIGALYHTLSLVFASICILYYIGRGRSIRTVSLVHERHALLNALAQLLLRLLQAGSASRHQAKRLLSEREKFVMICRQLGMEATTNWVELMYLSKSFSGPRGRISSAPPRPNLTFDAKNGSSVT